MSHPWIVDATMQIQQAYETEAPGVAAPTDAIIPEEEEEEE
jgi:hypothetical protein